MTDIIPAIDIMDGRCIRLTKGDYSLKKIYDSSPVDMALQYQDCGVKRIHIVDLDGARDSSPKNLKTLEQIASAVGTEIEWGGGVSSEEALHSIFDAGADCGIIGTVAVREPFRMHGWLKTFGPDRIILGADLRDGRVAVRGWTEDSVWSIGRLMEEYVPDALSQIICTDISCDGMLTGPNFRLYGELQEAHPGIIFTVSGGISSFDDIIRLDDMKLKRVIVGKAIYESRITLKEIERWSQNA